MQTRSITALLLSGLLLTACGGGSSAPIARVPVSTPKASLQPKNFAADCGDFINYVAESLTNQYLNVYQCYADAPCPLFATSGVTAVDSGAPTTGAPVAAPAPSRVSETNTQERGVDEADIVKADLRGYLYILSGHTLSVLDAHPADELDTAPLATLDLATDESFFYARDLFLDTTAQRLVIFGERSNSTGRSEAVSIFVDVSEPTAPVERLRLAVDGYGMEARRIGARVHRVVGYQPTLPSWFFDGTDPLVQRREAYLSAHNNGRDAEAEQQKKDIGNEINSRLRNAGADALLPRLRSQMPGAAESETVMACSAIAHPAVSEGLGFVLIDSFGTEGATRASSGLVNNAYIVYASPNNLYLAQSSSGWFFARSQKEETAIYRLALPSTGAASFQGLGKVDGSVIGSYALSEHEGFLRVASTESRFGPGRSESGNHLSVLDARTADMGVVGQLRELAPGERIQGVRMLGERGYLVTFRQVDPLFGLDLSNPTQPRVASELKLPGFSSYLSPIGDDYLLTVGRAGSDEGLNGQLGIQLFDVRNLAAIQQVDGITPSAGSSSYSYSLSEYDPHAFTYFPDAETAAAPGTLVVPLQTYGEQEADRFSGFVVVRVEPVSSTPLREIGRISHAGFPDRQNSCGSMPPGETFAPCQSYYQMVEPRRAVFIQDASLTALLTISSVGVIASNAAMPSQELARRELPYDEPCCFYATTANR